MATYNPYDAPLPGSGASEASGAAGGFGGVEVGGQDAYAGAPPDVSGGGEQPLSFFPTPYTGEAQPVQYGEFGGGDGGGAGPVGGSIGDSMGPGGASGGLGTMGSGTGGAAPYEWENQNRKINLWTGRFDDEPPLLEELGIDFKSISARTKFVLSPLQRFDATAAENADLAGPLVFAFALATFLLLSGKVHFGYIYGMGAVGCGCMYVLLNLMSENGVGLYNTVSVLGYCLLPMVLLAGASVVVPLSGYIGLIFSCLCVGWCARCAAAMFAGMLNMHDQFLLILYPVGLVYTCFALLTVF